MNLSPREREVLSLIASGLTLYQVARRLHISYGTAQDYRNRVFDKLGATSSAHAVALALLAGVELSVLSLFAPQKKRLVISVFSVIIKSWTPALCFSHTWQCSLG